MLFPPAVPTGYAGQVVEKFAADIAGLLEAAAGELSSGPVTIDQTTRWLQESRRLNWHAPRVDRALAHAEESRRLNLRAIGTPPVGLGLRSGLDALEHSSVSMRTLFRAIDDATRERTGVHEDPRYAEDVRLTAAALMHQMGGVVRAFGRLLRAEVHTGPGPEREQLAALLDALRSGRKSVHQLLITDHRNRDGLWEHNSAVLTAADRMLAELDVRVLARQEARRDAAISARRLAALTAGRLRARDRGLVSRTRRRRLRWSTARPKRCARRA